MNDHAVEAPIQRLRAIGATGLILICFVAWLAFQIPQGILTSTDELLTAERTREMLLTEPWVVHFNFERCFAKPPLQYWLTMLTLPRFKNPSLAVRIWPLVYAILTMIVLAWLAVLIEPERLWAAPLSLLVLISSPLFSAEAARALLDIGLTFFATLAIVFAQLARKHPAWWLGVAITCWLGTLQKIPLIFLIWLLIVIIRLSSRSERKGLLSGWLFASVILAVAAMAIWPLIQFVKYQMPLESVFQQEVVVLVGPTRLGARPYLEIPFRLGTAAWIGGGIFALIAPFAVLLLKKPQFPSAAKEISIVCLLLIGLAVVSNFRSARYMLPILPCLCFLLANVLHRFLERSGPVRARTIVFLALIMVAGIIQAQIQMYTGRVNVADEKRVAEKLGDLQREEAEIRSGRPSQSVLIDTTAVTGKLPFDDFCLFHGHLREPLRKYTVDEIRRIPPAPPLIGVCLTHDLFLIRELYPNLNVRFTQAQFSVWRVDVPKSRS